ncbi:MAG: hypothetical protein IT376_10280 [Polyangiaceae bacterium]|nr:hypothetical protein [Polyangiaceae bacterium]
MIRPLLASLAACVALALLAGACGSEGNTPSCPELPLYNVREDASGIPPERAEAVAQGCATGPGDATSGTTD